MKTRPEPLAVTEFIFDELEDLEIFRRKTTQHFRHLFIQGGGYEPVINETRLGGAAAAFVAGKKQAEDEGRNDYFQLAGILAYWLARGALVDDLRSLNAAHLPPDAELAGLLREFPSEFAAYDFGLYICAAFDAAKVPPDGMPKVGIKNYRDMCFLLKRKIVSPDALGAVYCSLFIPLHS